MNTKCPECYRDLVERTVQKEGPNFGRKFLTCPQQPSCKIPKNDPRGSNFVWLDGQPSNRQSPKRQKVDTEGTLEAINNLRHEILSVGNQVAELRALMLGSGDVDPSARPMPSPRAGVPKFGQH